MPRSVRDQGRLNDTGDACAAWTRPRRSPWFPRLPGHAPEPHQSRDAPFTEIRTGTQPADSTRSSRATWLSYALPAQRSSSAPGFGQVSPGPDPTPFSRPISLHISHLRKTNVLVACRGCYPGLEPGSSPLPSLKIGFVVRRLETGMELRMKESHRKGVANHLDPESCVASREAAIEA